MHSTTKHYIVVIIKTNNELCGMRPQFQLQLICCSIYKYKMIFENKRISSRILPADVSVSEFDLEGRLYRN